MGSIQLTQTRSAQEVRQMIRDGLLRVPTSGYADTYMQANLMILPEKYAEEFKGFCDKNPKSCPLIAMGKPGDPTLPSVGKIDIRTDVARYRIYQCGKHVDTVDNLRDIWRHDLVIFALGCSFSFENAILNAGIEIRHTVAKRNVPMYKTNVANVAHGSFAGNLVVSLRAFHPQDLIHAIVLSERFPLAHGAPVHIGNPEKIGIKDVHKPDFGDAPIIYDDDMLGFWACGVTSQLAIEQANVDLAIAHEPGYMLITDLPADTQRITQK